MGTDMTTDRQLSTFDILSAAAFGSPAGAGETAPHPTPSPALARLRAVLPEELARKVSSGAELVRSRSHIRIEVTPTCVESFDMILGGGLLKGRIVELTARRSSGRFSIAIAALAATTSAGELAALVDLGDSLDARSAEDAGVDMERLLWVRPETTKEAVMSAELLVATGFPLVVVDLGMRLRGRKVADATWIRLARAAESHGTAILVSSPWPVCGTAAAAAVRIERAKPAWLGAGRTPRLLGSLESRMCLMRTRERATGASEGAVATWQMSVAERIDLPQRAPRLPAMRVAPTPDVALDERSLRRSAGG
jgi:hypothetical protein